MHAIIVKLNRFHLKLADTHLQDFSPIAGEQFPGDFNVSGFHEEILHLNEQPHAVWGIDRCIRIQDIPSDAHAYVFHMGVFAKSIDLDNEFMDPFRDERFFNLQKEVSEQFLRLMRQFDIALNDLEVTYFGGAIIGGNNLGRDRLLCKKYKFSEDTISRDLFKKSKTFPIASVANIDINSIEGSLVGPRLEIAYRGNEIATIVFDCYKISDGKLKPINYVGGYAIGVERLIAALAQKSLIESLDRYRKAAQLLKKEVVAAGSSLFKSEVRSILFGSELLAHSPQKLTGKRKERVNALKRELFNNALNLGVDKNIIETLINFYKKLRYL